MDIFGIGALELVFILLIALIILGPEQMVKVARTLGRWLRKMNLSPTMREIRNLPYRMMREAGIEDLDLNVTDEKPSRTPPPPAVPPIKQSPNTIGIQGVIPSEWVSDPSRVEEPQPAAQPPLESPAPSEWVTPPSPAKPSTEEGKQA